MKIAFQPIILVTLLALGLAACAGEPAGTPGTTQVIPPAPTGSFIEEAPAQAATAPATPVSPATAEAAPTILPATATEVSPATEQGSPPPGATVATLPDPESAAFVAFASGLDRPIGIMNAGDGSGRLFVLEQPGTIRVIRAGQVTAEPFLNIRDRVRSTGSEQGLLGLAFHPNWVQNGFFYVNYTDLNGDTVIARFTAEPGRDQADPASETVLLQVDQPFPNHNGGMLAFGPDGYLYIALGDGGSANDPRGNAQSTQTLLGKILRIDVDGGEPYGFPADNPFASTSQGLPEIWAYGLRNPWRFAFDRANGDLYIADVGQGDWEEIDYWAATSPPGPNFGWDYYEGTHRFEGSPPASLELIGPVYEYDHSQGSCSVTGGVVYRGAALPQWQGVYLFADYCSGLVWGMIPAPSGWQTDLLYATGYNVTSFGEDEAGEVYLADHNGTIYRLEGK